VLNAWFRVRHDLDFMRINSRWNTIVQPIVILKQFNIDVKASTCFSSRSPTIMTGRVLYFPKNAYRKRDGRSFSSNSRGSSIDCFAGGVSLFFQIQIYLLWCILTFMNPSNAFTFSSFCAMFFPSKFMITTANASTPNLFSIGTSYCSSIVKFTVDTT